MAEAEELQIKITAATCELNEAELRELCTELEIVIPPEQKGRWPMIQLFNKFLDAEELDLQALGKIEAQITTVKQKATGMGAKKQPESPQIKTEGETEKKLGFAVPAWRRDFKISGQIGDVSQKDRLSFSSLIHQVENGLNRGYKEKEVIEAVIKAINPALRLRSYLEGKPDLTLAKVRRILRSHYQEKAATELYHQLSSAAQGPKETAQDFLIRLLDLRQKVLFASKEADSGLQYDPALVHGMFLHSLLTGFQSDNIKVEMKPFLQDSTLSDEELFEKLNASVNSETERQQKLGSQSKTKLNSAQLQDQGEKRMEQTLLKELRELKAEIAAVKETVQHPPQSAGEEREWHRQGRAASRTRGCHSCQQRGQGDMCNHCFKCGGSGHYSRGCRAQSQPLQREWQGNDQRSHPRDRV